jgi:hypothetical protein
MWALGLAATQAAVTYGLRAQRAYSSAHRYVREEVEKQLLERDQGMLGKVELQHYGAGKEGSSENARKDLILAIKPRSAFVMGVTFAAISLITAIGTVSACVGPR